MGVLRRGGRRRGDEQIQIAVTLKIERRRRTNERDASPHEGQRHGLGEPAVAQALKPSGLFAADEHVEEAVTAEICGGEGRAVDGQLTNLEGVEGLPQGEAQGLLGVSNDEVLKALS